MHYTESVKTEAATAHNGILKQHLILELLRGPKNEVPSGLAAFIYIVLRLHKAKPRAVLLKMQSLRSLVHISAGQVSMLVIEKLPVCISCLAE